MQQFSVIFKMLRPMSLSFSGQLLGVLQSVLAHNWGRMALYELASEKCQMFTSSHKEAFKVFEHCGLGNSGSPHGSVV